jgi:uncharacterized glyoxalase superfamily protein PhnB
VIEARLALVSILCRDVDAVVRFYADGFGFAEDEMVRSPIYRQLAAGDVALGFHTRDAYALLGLDGHDAVAGTRSMLMFEVGSDREVDAMSAVLTGLGAIVHAEPYDTYYDARQAVLSDPEGNVFRINHYRSSHGGDQR